MLRSLLTSKKANFGIKKIIKSGKVHQKMINIYMHTHTHICIYTHTYIYIVEYYSSIKKNEMLFTTTWDWRVVSLVK